MNERDIFIAALQKEDPVQRRSYLDEACADQPELRQQVEELLRLHQDAGSFLEQPAAEPPATGAFQAAAEQTSSREGPGTLIGHYKLLEPIGEGGMGTVWMAQQTEPVRRLVAAKLIKAGMDSKQVIARFEAERQALALMDHPNIARVLDGGTTDSDRPYFVMDLVKGVPITRYCDEHHLTPRQRLELFIPVCEAIQHAHQKGIIHRDVKPSNVLVALYDDRPVPKVIDFGVAKAAGPTLTKKTLVTGFGMLVGTLEYMSPEQAELNNLDIDTRSDIYSLGVLLYELLTGGPPFNREEREDAGVLEMLRVIREEEPTKPSAKLSTAEGLPTLAANRGMEPARLTRLVRGELDWIVMKALDKDRSRRYETANAFAMDVQRYLADEPVQACPPSMGYRFGKFVRRNKRTLITAALLGTMLLVVAGAFGWMARDSAALRKQTAELVGHHLQLAESDYTNNRLPEAIAEVQKARGVLDTGRGNVERERQVQQWQTDLATASKLVEIRLEMYEVEREREYRAFAQAFEEYGIDLETLSVEEAAEQIAASRIKQDLVVALDIVAIRLKFDRRKQEPARWQRLLAISRAADPDPWRLRFLDAILANDVPGLRAAADSADLSKVRTHALAFLGDLLGASGDPEAAVAFLRKAQHRYPGDFAINSFLCLSLALLKPVPLDEALACQRAALAVRPQTAWAHNALGRVLLEQNKFDQAVASINRALELNPEYIGAYLNLGNTLVKQKKPGEAVVAYRKALALEPRSASIHAALGLAFHKQGKMDDAFAWYHKALDLDPKCLGAHVNLGVAWNEQNKPDKAIACYETALDIKPDDLEALVNLGSMRSGQKRLNEAEVLLRKALKLHPYCVPAFVNLSAVLAEQKKTEEAFACARSALRLDPRCGAAWVNLGNALRMMGKEDEAIDAYFEALRVEPDTAPSRNQLIGALIDRAFALSFDHDPKKRNPPRAVKLARRVIELEPKLSNYWDALGIAEYRAGNWKETIAAFEQSQKMREGNAGDWLFLAMAHWQLGNKDEARKLYDRAMSWMKKTGITTVHLRRIHTEAANLLGIEKQD